MLDMVRILSNLELPTDRSSVTGLSMPTLASPTVDHSLLVSELGVVAVRRSLVHHHRQHCHHDHCQHHHGTEGSHPLGLGQALNVRDFHVVTPGALATRDRINIWRDFVSAERQTEAYEEMGTEKATIFVFILKPRYPKVYLTPHRPPQIPSDAFRALGPYPLYSLRRPPQIGVSRSLAYVSHVLENLKSLAMERSLCEAVRIRADYNNLQSPQIHRSRSDSYPMNPDWSFLYVHVEAQPDGKLEFLEKLHAPEATVEDYGDDHEEMNRHTPLTARGSVRDALATFSIAPIGLFVVALS
ncbi:hypothetical protein BKA70DRAFT_1223192 [Coprinopsis sp. MPI-PUGE-AT-0042]|nr:hypothetical protein BKA70DRAFT_1223192 [Coprinopsis sp. MPI-PUGE-AT-0042]